MGEATFALVLGGNIAVDKGKNSGYNPLYASPIEKKELLYWVTTDATSITIL